MDRKWFESMFEGDSKNDKWGHQYRATQQIRLNKSFNLINKYLKTNMKISDVCCGLGDFLGRFKNKNTFGFDISQNAITKARYLYPDIDFMQNELPNIPNNYDVIIALECIYYINVKEASVNIYNALNKSGLFLVSVPIDYENNLIESLSKFNILEQRYTYFGLFSRIEEKLVFYSKDLDYILERKASRKRYLLSKLLNSRISIFIKQYISLMQRLSLIILQSYIVVKLFSLIPIKRHIIILAQKK